MAPEAYSAPAIVFAQHGYAAVVVNRRGFGQSSGPLNVRSAHATIAISAHATHAQASRHSGSAYGDCGGEPWVDADRIVLVGHSLGGLGGACRGNAGASGRDRHRSTLLAGLVRRCPVSSASRNAWSRRCMTSVPRRAYPACGYSRRTTTSSGRRSRGRCSMHYAAGGAPRIRRCTAIWRRRPSADLLCRTPRCGGRVSRHSSTNCTCRRRSDCRSARLCAALPDPPNLDARGEADFASYLAPREPTRRPSPPMAKGTTAASSRSARRRTPKPPPWRIARATAGTADLRGGQHAQALMSRTNFALSAAAASRNDRSVPVDT